MRLEPPGSGGIGHLKIAADLSGEKIVDLSMSRNGGGLLHRPIHEHGVIAPFAEQFAPMRFEMADEVTAFHAAEM